jgi:phage-related minor tail protein
VNKATRTPLEEYMAQLPLTADKMTEALQRVEVDGLQHLEDGLMGVITGTMKVKDAFHQMAAAILEDLLRIAIEKYIIGTITSALGLGTGGTPVAGARAGGGPVMSGNAYLVGEKGPEIFTPSSSGNITANDNLSLAGMSGAPRVSVVNNNDFRGADPQAMAAIEARQARFERELPGKVIQYWNDGRDRFAIRGRPR